MSSSRSSRSGGSAVVEVRRYERALNIFECDHLGQAECVKI